MQLLNEWERGVHFSKFNVDALLRGEFTIRMRGYAIGRQNGWLSANDIREFEDMNPIAGGDVYLVNGNMISATETKPQAVDAPPPREPPKPKKAKKPKEDNTE